MSSEIRIIEPTPGESVPVGASFVVECSQQIHPGTPEFNAQLARVDRLVLGAWSPGEVGPWDALSGSWTSPPLSIATAGTATLRVVVVANDGTALLGSVNKVTIHAITQANGGTFHHPAPGSDVPEEAAGRAQPHEPGADLLSEIVQEIDAMRADLVLLNQAVAALNLAIPAAHDVEGLQVHVHGLAEEFRAHVAASLEHAHQEAGDGT